MRTTLGLKLIEGVTLGLENGAAAQQADAPQLAQRGAQQKGGRLGLGIIKEVTLGLEDGATA